MIGIEFDLFIFQLVERFPGRMQSNRKVARVNILAAQKAVGGRGRRRQRQRTYDSRAQMMLTSQQGFFIFFIT